MSPRPCGGHLGPARVVARSGPSPRPVLALERHVVTGAVGRRRAGAGLVDAETVAAVVAVNEHLSPEQVAMLRAVTGSGDGVQVV